MKRLITDYEFSWVSPLPTQQNAWNVILQFLQSHFFAAMLVFASVVWQKTILDDEFMNFMKMQSNSLVDSGHTPKKGKIFRVKMRPRILFLRPEFLKSSGRKLRVLIFIGKVSSALSSSDKPHNRVLSVSGHCEGFPRVIKMMQLLRWRRKIKSDISTTDKAKTVAK